jgi:1,4-alpha-glucan branching enzyme
LKNANRKKDQPIADLIDLSDAKSIAGGVHRDPFSILGGHKKDAGFVVCAFDPGAEEISVLTGKAKETPLLPVSGAPGVFVGRLNRKSAYRLRARAHGNAWDYDDAFRFGPVLGSMDEHLISEGTHRRLWQILGAHLITHEGADGVHFALWAPNAGRVSVIGDFNHWDGRRHPMRRRGSTGVWEIFIPGFGEGTVYKYEISDGNGTLLPLKADPVGFGSEHPPQTGSVVRNLDGHDWQDDGWMDRRAALQNINAPISIYEVHLGSWRRVPEDGNRPLSYVESARQLVDYAVDMGFTHLELLPVSEFPFDGSWGYQPIGLYAPTIRFGPPEEFRALIEAAHDKGLGILLDWVPGHFPTDIHGLGSFDGTSLYEYADPKEGFHQDWNTLIYNYGRVEVMNFLIANAVYWLREHHVDGLRVDAVASMLYRDYSRKEGEWIPNEEGGRENLEAIRFLKRMNETVYAECPGIVTIAEESTAFPGISRPTDADGLGFGFKWNMGWMHDTLDYIQKDPVHRKYHHHQMTFGLTYAYSENFILPISHDEVVHGKGSMITKMPGEGWEKFANLRTYYSFMWTHPGKKLLFMGCEIAQGLEWNHDSSVEWHLLEHEWHKGVQSLVRDLNKIYREYPALHVKDCDPAGFEWIDIQAETESVYSYLRRGNPGDPPVVVVCNFAPVERDNWRIGLPAGGRLSQVLNTDAHVYGGGGRGVFDAITAEDIPWNGRAHSAAFLLPPLSTLIFTLE